MNIHSLVCVFVCALVALAHTFSYAHIQRGAWYAYACVLFILCVHTSCERRGWVSGRIPWKFWWLRGGGRRRRCCPKTNKWKWWWSAVSEYVCVLGKSADAGWLRRFWLGRSHNMRYMCAGLFSRGALAWCIYGCLESGCELHEVPKLFAFGPTTCSLDLGEEIHVLFLRISCVVLFLYFIKRYNDSKHTALINYYYWKIRTGSKKSWVKYLVSNN